MENEPTQTETAAPPLQGPQCSGHRDQTADDRVVTYVCQLVEGHEGDHRFAG